MAKIGKEWQKEILSRTKQRKNPLTAKDRFVKEYVGKIKKKEESRKKKKSKVSYPRQSRQQISRTPQVRKRLGPKPIRL